MIGKYRATIYVWPFHGGSEKECGPKRVERDFPNCADFNEAKRLTDVFLDGVRTNPSVWQTGIEKLEHVER